MATHWTLGCDAADPHRLAAFWALALGYVTEPGYDKEDGAPIIDPDGNGPAIGFLRVPVGKAAKDRIHIDIRAAGKPPRDVAGRERRIRAKVAEPVTAPDASRMTSGTGTRGPGRAPLRTQLWTHCVARLDGTFEAAAVPDPSVDPGRACWQRRDWL